MIEGRRGGIGQAPPLRVRLGPRGRTGVPTLFRGHRASLTHKVRTDRNTGCSAESARHAPRDLQLTAVLLPRNGRLSDIAGLACAWVPVPSWGEGPIKEPLGVKARGLLSLPQDWVPDFIVLQSRLATADARCNEQAWNEVLDRIGARRRILARSDGPDESASPGLHRTWATTLEEFAATSPGPSDRWPLLQVAVEPAAVGAMSNDRRLTPRRDLWVAEGPVVDLRPRVVRFRRARSAGSEPLRADHDDFLPALRRVAALPALREGRHRVEWVWDGAQLWLVQVDPVADPSTDPRATRLMRRRDQAVWSPRQTPEPTGWHGPKTSSREVMARLSLPVVPMIASRLSELRTGQQRKEWAAEVLETLDEPVVLRVDARNGDEFMLPTSAPLRVGQDLARFVEQVVAESLGDRDPETLAVLASPLVQTVVSALSTQEQDGTVTIDSLWGYPDGLGHLPHDSARVTADGDLTFTRRPKLACLVMTREGERREVSLGVPLDWGITLNADECAAIAEWTRALGEAVEYPIHLMVLCRIDGARGRSAMIPFHFVRAPNQTETERSPWRPAELFVIRDPADLGSIAEADEIEFAPNAEFARDPGFISAVGRAAAEHEVLVRFLGSKLGHARFLLELEGARVVLEDGDESDEELTPVIAESALGLLRLTFLAEDEVDLALSDRAGHLCDTFGPLNLPRLSREESAGLTRRRGGAGHAIGFTE